MTGQNVSYIRVSSYDQNTERQLEGLTVDREFKEKASGKDTERPALRACLEHLRAGDTLHVHSIDRLARNLKDLQDLVEKLTGKGVVVQFHKERLTFTGGENPMQKLMFQMIGAVAEFERALIKERQREGIQNALKKGVRFGAQKKLTDEQVEQIRERVQKGEQKKALAAELGVSRQTLYTALGR
ncbi:recombinase family protein [Desulfopila sp. IMCC35006]|uniref:recombinase family protein n=1 Tax=Desulfopila sp. IMCC35006 TaxID=2569542 RepID=UPI0010ACF400|nr:recombinase family protein [Desulfopila sp. IMCC35006]TKB26068.1 recombinase family protein [Desulfopila sp. IMCC35006]